MTDLRHSTNVDTAKQPRPRILGDVEAQAVALQSLAERLRDDLGDGLAEATRHLTTLPATCFVGMGASLAGMRAGAAHLLGGGRPAWAMSAAHALYRAADLGSSA